MKTTHLEANGTDDRVSKIFQEYQGQAADYELDATSLSISVFILIGKDPVEDTVHSDDDTHNTSQIENEI